MVGPDPPRGKGSRRLAVEIERWPIAGSFTISRGSRTEAAVVVATIVGDGFAGRGECVPYPRYGETVEGVAAAIRTQGEAVADELDREGLSRLLPAGAARNALDSALWDFEAKRSGRRVWALAGLPDPRPLTTAYTLSLGTPDAMLSRAQAASARPLLKVKLGGDGDSDRIAAVREGAPASRLIVDANEAWEPGNFVENMRACELARVELVEQPFPAQSDAALARFSRSVPVCADESVHDRQTLPDLAGRYDAVNVKLDKTGGLTEALALAAEARARGFLVMVGCMVGTSLAMAPAVLAAQQAEFVDLDGPLLLARDREPGLRYQGSLVSPPEPSLWG